MKKVLLTTMTIILLSVIYSACQTGTIGTNVPKSESSQISSTTELEQISSYKLVGNQTQTNEEVEVKSLVEKFISQKPIAFNSNSFSLISDIIEKESPTYKILELETGYVFARGIKVKLVSYEIQNIVRDDNLGVYKVYTNEKVELNYPKMNLVISNFSWVNTVKKIGDKFLLIGMEAGEDTPITEKLIKSVPTMQAEKIQNDKFEMVQSAMDGVLEYLDVDYTKKKSDNKKVGCGFAYGSSLTKFLGVNEDRKLRIENKKLIIKVISSEVSSSSHSFDKGVVSIYFKLEISENGVGRMMDFSTRVNLLNMGADTWYIESIEPLLTI